jgi:hypothetical protein
MTAVLLQWTDKLELHEAGAHLSMALRALRVEHPDLITAGAPEVPFDAGG